MEYAVIGLQLVAALGIYNVWLLRFGKSTAFRGGAAGNMKEEFEAYGLPAWSVQAIGFLKLLFATCLIIGIWYPPLTRPAAIGLAILMLGAIAMHIKISDPPKKSLPAAVMLLLSVCIAVAA